MQEGETSHHYVTISNTSEALLFNNVFKDSMSAGASYVPGSVIVNGIVFNDPIPAGTTFVADSVKINGVSYPAYNPAVGFNLPDLAPDAAATIEFDVKVN